jgi:O-antigen ligase
VKMAFFPGTGTIAARVGILFIAFMVPLLFSIRLEDGFELTQTLCALVAAVFLILVLQNVGWWRLLKSNGFVYFSFFGFLAAGAYSFRDLVHETSFYFPTQNYLWVLSALIFLIPVGLYVEKEKLYAFLALSGVVGSFYSFAQALGLDLGGWSTNFAGRSFSTLGNPVFWAGHLLVLVPLAVYLGLSAKDRSKRLFWFGVTGILVLSLLTTKTRGAWLGIMGEAVLFAILNRGKSQVWKGVMIGMIAFLLPILLVPSLTERVTSTFRGNHQDAQGRYFLWKVAGEMWKEKKLFGQGPGGFANHFPKFQADLHQAGPPRSYQTAYHAHQEYLEILAERGLVGFAFGALLIWGLVRKRIRDHGIFITEVASSLSPAYSAGTSRNDSHLMISASSAEIAIMVGIGIHSLFNFPLSIVPTACALALLFNPSWGHKREPVAGSFWTESRFFLGIALLAFCAFAMKVGAQNARLHQAVDHQNVQRYEEALKSLDFDPSSRWFHYFDPRVLKQKALALDALGRQEEGVQACEKVIESYPNDADAHGTLCMLYGKGKHWDEAKEEGERALEIAPFHEPSLNNLAMVAYLRGRPREAIGYLSRLEALAKAKGETEKASQIRQKISALSSTR